MKKIYTREELLDILKEVYYENDHKITPDSLIKRSKVKPTPTWQTFVRRLGYSSTWQQLIALREDRLKIKLQQPITIGPMAS